MISRHRRLRLVLAALLLETAALWQRGYGVGGNVTVRCRGGHLFTTIWIPGVSLKAIRLGWWRVQYCPVGRHWSVVTPVKRSELTDEEAGIAGENADIRIP